MVLIRVDLPRPVCPTRGAASEFVQWARENVPGTACIIDLTNANNIELETTLEKLLLDLLGDAVETDVAFGIDGGLLGVHRGGWGGV